MNGSEIKFKHFAKVRDAVRKAKRLLVSKGCIKIVQRTCGKGKFLRNDYEIYSSASPLTENPSTENPRTDLPSTENQATYKDYNSNKNRYNKNRYIEDYFFYEKNINKSYTQIAADPQSTEEDLKRISNPVEKDLLIQHRDTLKSIWDSWPSNRKTTFQETWESFYTLNKGLSNETLEQLKYSYDQYTNTVEDPRYCKSLQKFLNEYREIWARIKEK